MVESGPQPPVGTSTTLRCSFPEPVTQDRRIISCRTMSQMRTKHHSARLARRSALEVSAMPKTAVLSSASMEVVFRRYAGAIIFQVAFAGAMVRAVLAVLAAIGRLRAPPSCA